MGCPAGVDGVRGIVPALSLDERAATGVVAGGATGLGRRCGGRFPAILRAGCSHGPERNRWLISGGHERGRLWPDPAGHLAHQWALECLGGVGSVAAFAGTGVRPVVPEPGEVRGLIYLPITSTSCFGPS